MFGLRLVLGMNCGAAWLLAANAICAACDLRSAAYLQAVRVLAFLHGVAEGLLLEPAIRLAAADRARMQFYSRSLRLRQAACKTALQESQPLSLD